MTELRSDRSRRNGMSLLTKRLLSTVAFVAAMAIGLSLGFLAVRLFTG
ncbi:MAG: hypothetical protein H0T40_07645 [Geodermatophilaceae bacterium]|jgi:hypothetical protein|nr:hypothetical protein [Geodermatophilaceae bacterium]